MYVVPAGVVYGAEAAAFSERASSWGNASTGHVHAFHGGYWGNWVFEIKSHDAANRTLHFGAGGSQGQYTAAAPPHRPHRRTAAPPHGTGDVHYVECFVKPPVKHMP